MMSSVETTKINIDGLRYKSKEGGTPFGASSNIGTMSCYKCGLGKSIDQFNCIECKQYFDQNKYSPRKSTTQLKKINCK
jgi:hypothetical protein